MNFQQTYNRLDPLDPFNLFKGFQRSKEQSEIKGSKRVKKTKYFLLYSHCTRTALETFRFMSASSKRWSRFHVRSLRSSCPKRFTMETSKKNENVMYIIYLGNPFVNFCRNSISTISNSAEIGCSWVVLICNQSWVRAIPPESWAIPPKLVSNDGIPPKAVLRAKSENSAEIPNGKNFHTFGVLRYTV